MGKTDKLLRQHPLLGVVILAVMIMEIVKLMILTWILVEHYGHKL